MKKEELVVGELYYSAMNGICMITELHEERDNLIGCYQDGRGRSILLYTKPGRYSDNFPFYRLATDEDIKGSIVHKMMHFELGDEVELIICHSENDEEVYISSPDNFVCLKKDTLKNLLITLKREINL